MWMGLGIGRVAKGWGFELGMGLSLQWIMGLESEFLAN